MSVRMVAAGKKPWPIWGLSLSGSTTGPSIMAPIVMRVPSKLPSFWQQ